MTPTIDNSPLKWGAKQVFASTVVAAFLGLAYGFVLAFYHGVHEFAPGLIFTCALGGIVGLFASSVFALVSKLRDLAAGSKIKMAVVFAGLGMLPSAAIFSLFSEGLAMALFQAIYGSIIGAFIGATLGLLMAIFASKLRRS